MPATRPASTKTPAAKLLLKPGMTLVVLSGPPEVDALLGPLPEGVTLSTRARRGANALLVFAADRTGLDRRLPSLEAASADALIWVAYPKQTARIDSDLNRDILRELLAGHGLEEVTLVSLDDTWSAMRFKRR